MQLLQIPKGLKPIARVPYGTLASAFVGANPNGNKGVWFAFARNGFGPTYMFPVLEDGKISRVGGVVLGPETIMCVFEPAELGVKEISWTKTKPN
jgi:hypothetical protein